MKDRVKAMFGPPYGVKLTARENGDGTEARILLPRLTRKPDEGGGDGHVENRSR
ncbi:hypothetical protein N6H14_08430 [Paenibacillus sp. CC-CFT747]|nr:hypothetical protein N6H14_08430 [Paenibacillus sp. CC-CFT747]